MDAAIEDLHQVFINSYYIYHRVTQFFITCLSLNEILDLNLVFLTL
jgi:hypothetical protein